MINKRIFYSRASGVFITPASGQFSAKNSKMINIPIKFEREERTDDGLWMVRYNFEPEGMEKDGATLSLDKGTHQVNVEFPHAEKVSRNSLNLLPKRLKIAFSAIEHRPLLKNLVRLFWPY